MNRSDLDDGQLQALEFAEYNPKCALWLGLGRGKTVVAATYLQNREPMGGRALVIAGTKRIAFDTWPTELEKWDHLTFDWVAIEGKPALRLELLKRQAFCSIINVELLPWLCQQYTADTWPFDTVIVDESSKLQSYGKRFKSLKRVSPAIERMVQLTATPASNSLMGLWTQFWLLDGGKRLGRTLTVFRTLYFDYLPYRYEYRLRDGSEERIHSAVSDITFRLDDKPGTRQNPEPIDVWVDLPADGRRVYKELQQDLLADVDGTQITAVTAAVLSSKLRQVANGFLYNEETEGREIHEGKFLALREILDLAGDQNILCFYDFTYDRDRILRSVDEAVSIDEPNATERWTRGEIKLLVAHPASAGHGLNLQYGGSLVVWYGLPWSLELYDQANGRIDRQGQDKPVRVFRILTRSTIDERIPDVLAGKAKIQDALLQAVR